MNLNLITEPLIGPDRVLDVREVPCSIKHRLILKSWHELPLGDHFILVNGHDPVPLFHQFSAEFPGAFKWEHLLRNPDEVRVKITRTQPTLARELDSPCR
jgi:uncharacterized protein (DUF2249 family)